jgi:sugar phosphate isomerase/epimerase
MSASQLRPVVNLLHASFEGVVTLEVFSEADLMDSLRTLREMLHK